MEYKLVGRETEGRWVDIEHNCTFLLFKAVWVQPECYHQTIFKKLGDNTICTGLICWGMRGRPSPQLLSLYWVEPTKSTVTAVVSLWCAVLFQFIWQLVSWLCCPLFPHMAQWTHPGVMVFDQVKEFRWPIETPGPSPPKRKEKDWSTEKKGIQQSQ